MVMALWFCIFWMRARLLKPPSLGKNRRSTLIEIPPHTLGMGCR
jgi:hypothetical protein